MWAQSDVKRGINTVEFDPLEQVDIEIYYHDIQR